MTPPILRTFRIGPLQISECPEPGVVELCIPDGACRLSEAQWRQLGSLTAGYSHYGTDYVKFVKPPAQAELPLEPATEAEQS